MTNAHCYLFALEVKPMIVGEIYGDLPLHCTLMHRFWSELDAKELAGKVRDCFEGAPAPILDSHERLLLGPKQVAVSELVLTDELKSLHTQLYERLNGLGVEYTAPEWVGEGYRAHITERTDSRLEVGVQYVSKAVYLIEVKVPGHDHQRLIRSKFYFK